MPERTPRLKGLYVPVQVGADVASLAIALVAAYEFRIRTSTFFDASPNDLSTNLLGGVWIMVLGWILAIEWSDGYNWRFLSTGSKLYQAIIQATTGAAGVTGVLLYLTVTPLSRVFFIVFFVLGPILLILNRAVLRRVLNQVRAKGRWRMDTIVVGALPHVESLSHILKRQAWLGYDITGVVVPKDDPRRHSNFGLSVLGEEPNLNQIVLTRRPDAILFAAGSTIGGDSMRRLAWELEDMDVDMIVVPAISEIASNRVTMRPVAGLPLVHMDPPRARMALKWSKRVFDILSSGAGLIVLSPLFLVLALLVKSGDGGPVFFSQKRVGREGAEFDFYKFRSMVPDAEKIRAGQLENSEGRDRGNAVMFKMADDPRITKVGRVLRRYSLDELPQLWNVFKGDMSLIGPRPALPSEVEKYDNDARRRLSVRPGITGLWQVSGRSDLSWDETVRLDLFYVDNWSFAQDLSILIRTVKAVLASNGAY